MCLCVVCFFFSSRRRHTRCALVTGVQTCALPILLRSEPQRAGAADGFRLWSMCFALLGIQIVWGLQNANTSRIFQALGADVAELPLLWIAEIGRASCRGSGCQYV